MHSLIEAKVEILSGEQIAAALQRHRTQLLEGGAAAVAEVVEEIQIDDGEGTT